MSEPQTPEAAPAEKAFDAAIREGDPGALRQALDDHPELKARLDEPRFAYGAPAVVFAASLGSLALVEALVEAGADINAQSDWGPGPWGVLHHACWNHPELVEPLLALGARLDAWSVAGLGMKERLAEMLDAEPELLHQPGPEGMRPLHFAQEPQLIDFLLERGADLEARDIDHESTAAQWALGRRPEAVAHFLKRGAKADIFMAAFLDDPALARAALDEHPGCVDARIGGEGYPPVPPRTIYQYAILAGASPHRMARESGSREVYDLLQERSSPATRLIGACQFHDAETVRSIMAEQPGLAKSLPPERARALADAAWDNDLEAARLMLDAGFDPHVRGDNESTPLDRASFHGFPDMIRLLLERDPEPPLDWVNEFGGVPLSACLYGSREGWGPEGSDYPAAVEALIQGGCEFKESWLDFASDPVKEVLRRHLKT